MFQPGNIRELNLCTTAEDTNTTLQRWCTLLHRMDIGWFIGVPIGPQGWPTMVLEGCNHACFPAIPALLKAGYLDKVCSNFWLTENPWSR